MAAALLLRVWGRHTNRLLPGKFLGELSAPSFSCAQAHRKGRSMACRDGQAVLSPLGRSRWALTELIEFRSTVRDQSREAIANEVAPCSRRSTFCFWKHSGG